MQNCEHDLAEQCRAMLAFSNLACQMLLLRAVSVATLESLSLYSLTNFSLTSSFVGMYIEGDMFVSSSYYLYLMIFQFTILVRWILNLNGRLIKYMNMEA